MKTKELMNASAQDRVALCRTVGAFSAGTKVKVEMVTGTEVVCSPLIGEFTEIRCDKEDLVIRRRRAFHGTNQV